MSYIWRTCNLEGCEKRYQAKTADLARGWGRCCCKGHAAKLREQSKPGYDPDRVKRNNIRRANWNNSDNVPEHVKEQRNRKRFGRDAPNVEHTSGIISGISSEGYRVMDGTAYDEFDDPVYGTELCDMTQHPFDMSE